MPTGPPFRADHVGSPGVHLGRDSTVQGNALTVDEQRTKLRQVAREVWS